MIFPTWRMYIQGTFDYKSYESKYSRSFNLTEYFIFYNNLINNEQLLMKMKKLNYSGVLCLHPYFSKQWIDFNQNKIFSVLEICDYQNLLLKSSLLVTDYSSIFFDFAYLKKPIIYTQFDFEDYRRNHYPKDYFNYEIHGFGPVCYDFNCTINKIISKLENGCILEKKYFKRMKEFFQYFDDKNCERLYLNLTASINSKRKFQEYNNISQKGNILFLIFLLFILIKLILKCFI